jgi:hypothetical protein
MEFLSMISGNGLPTATECDDSGRERDATRALRDIQTLIAKLEVVNRLLAVPLRTRQVSLPPESESANPSESVP